ncbi:hypothetical protein CDC59_18310 (plasmid) [Ralstonia solanacearum]|nr:hypothetical protein CDC59_18310 [Ralstonia solanacearum]
MAAGSMRFRADRTASRPVLGRATQAQRGRANAVRSQQSINNARRKRDGDLHRHPRPACVHPASALRMRRDTVDAGLAGLMANQHEANHSPSVPPIALVWSGSQPRHPRHRAQAPCGYRVRVGWRVPLLWKPLP